MQKTTRNIIIAAAIIVALAYGATRFVMIANPTAPTYPVIKTEAWNGDTASTYIGDDHRDWNSAFLTVQGTVHFKSTVTTAGSVSITKMRLEVWTIIDPNAAVILLGTRVGNHDFTATVAQQQYDLYWDTTLITNGHYWLKIFTDLSDTTKKEYFSVLLNFDDGNGVPFEVPDYTLWFVLVGAAIIVVVFLWRRR